MVAQGFGVSSLGFDSGWLNFITCVLRFSHFVAGTLYHPKP